MGMYDDALMPVETPPPAAAPAAPPVSGFYSDALTPPPAPADAPPVDDPVVARGHLWPVSRTQSGKYVVDFGSGLTGAIGQALTLPGRVASGEMPMPQLGTRDPSAYGQIIPEAMNFATMTSPVTPDIAAGGRVIPGVATNVTRPRLPSPTVPELREAGGAQMNAFRDLPIRYNPAHIGQMADRVEGRLIDRGIFRDDASGIYNTLDLMRSSAQPRSDGATAVITPGSLHSLYQNITNKFGRQGEHQLAPQIARDELLNFISAPPEGAVLARSPTGQAFPGGAPALPGPGTPPLAPAAYGQQAGQLFRDAMGNLAGAHRGEAFDTLNREIDLKTAGAHSGRNLDNTTRQRVTRTLLDEDRSRGFVPSEVQGLEQAVYGDKTTNRLRDYSKVLGGGGGLGAAVSGTIGATAGAGLSEMFGVPGWAGAAIGGVIPPAVGERLGAWGAARTRSAVDAVNEATRARTPLGQTQPLLPLEAPGVGWRSSIARTLMEPGRASVWPDSQPSNEPPQRLYISPNRDTEEHA